MTDFSSPSFQLLEIEDDWQATLSEEKGHMWPQLTLELWTKVRFVTQSRLALESSALEQRLRVLPVQNNKKKTSVDSGPHMTLFCNDNVKTLLRFPDLDLLVSLMLG